MRRALPIVLVATGCCLSVVAMDEQDLELEPGVFNSSERCGECHQEIFDMWKRSLHSAAITDPVFEASYMRAYRETRGEAREICLRCHAPVASHIGDLELEKPISREGITCDYCHSIVSVDLRDSNEPFKLALDGVKRGPLLHAESPVHAVEKSDLHQRAEFCAGCHQYTNRHGIEVLSTYSEWKESQQAIEGRTCQNCHMPVTRGKVVEPPLGSGREEINLHNISGGHSTDQVRKAASVRILNVRRQGNEAVVEVEVANIGSGHSIPTGMPTRKLVLEVALYSGSNLVTRMERRYAKTILDGDGRLVNSDHRAVLEGARVVKDDRLRAGEHRVEVLRTYVLPKEPLRAEATLRYLYEPEILMPQRMSIDMASDEAEEKKR